MNIRKHIVNEEKHYADDNDRLCCVCVPWASSVSYFPHMFIFSLVLCYRLEGGARGKGEKQERGRSLGNCYS